jgi:hypothetical protein
VITRYLVLTGLTALFQVACSSRPATPSEAEPLHLPLQIIRSSAVTEITVGDQTVQAGVDTGGGGLTLSEEVIHTAGGVRLPDDLEWNDASGQAYRVPQFKIPVMNIGGRIFRDAVVAQAADWPEGEGPPVPNGIGGDFLSQYFAVIDFAGRSITLWPPDSPPLADATCGGVRVPMEETEQSGLVVSNFDTPSGTIRLLWDTGASYSMFPLSLVERSNLETILRGQIPFHTPAKLVSAGHEFGPLEFVVAPLELPNDDFQGMLGANFFTTHVVCIDYGKREIRVR